MEISKYLKRNNQNFISYEYVNSKGEKIKAAFFQAIQAAAIVKLSVAISKIFQMK